MRSKIVFYSVLAMLVTLFASLLYLSYGKYRQYTAVKRDIACLPYIRKSRDTVYALEKEAFISLEYLSTKEAAFREKMQQYRAETDAVLTQLEKGLAGRESMPKQQEALQAVKKRLVQLRMQVDRHEDDYNKILLEGYGKGCIRRLILSVSILSEVCQSDALRYELEVEASLLEHTVHYVMEEAFLSHIVKYGKQSDASVLSVWESILHQKTGPSVEMIQDSPFGKQLRKILDAKKPLEALNQMRKGAPALQFDENPDMLLQRFALLAVHAQEAEALLENHMEAEAIERLTELERQLLQYLVALLFVGVGILFVWRLFSRTSRERQALRETLAEMLDTLEGAEREALEQIIKKGDPTPTYRFLVDMTKEARKAREEAVEAEKAKDLFLASVSHEIGTPLNGILSAADQLEESEPNPKQQEILEVLRQSTHTLTKTIEDILDLSRIKVDKLEMQYLSFNALDTLNKAIEPHETKASDKKIEYTTYVDPLLPYLMGDPAKLSQVMTNLIGNAMKFTDYQGAVHVSIEKLDETQNEVTVRFSVKDNGLGISPEQKEHIFQPFTQVSKHAEKKFGGAGLGLTITKSLIERMGGTLELESEVGKGTEFYFTLTFEKGEKGEQVSHRFDDLKIGYFKPRGTARKNMEINLRRYIEATGAILEEFTTLDHAVIRSYDLVISDHSFIESRDNIELIASIASHTIVLAHISYRSDASILYKSVDSIIYKPLNIIKIIDAIEQALPERKQSGSHAAIDVDAIEEMQTQEVSDTILLYTRSQLIYKIHQDVLKEEGYSVEHVTSIEALISQVEQHEYAYLCIDAKRLDAESCIVAETLHEMGMKLLIWGKEEPVECHTFPHYDTIETLKEILRG